MSKRKELQLTPAEQSKLFKDAAKRAGVTGSEAEFEILMVARPDSAKQGQKPREK